MKDSVIIVSGGVDSVTFLYDKQEGIALGISDDNMKSTVVPFRNGIMLSIAIGKETFLLTGIRDTTEYEIEE